MSGIAPLLHHALVAIAAGLPAVAALVLLILFFAERGRGRLR